MARLLECQHLPDPDGRMGFAYRTPINSHHTVGDPPCCLASGLKEPGIDQPFVQPLRRTFINPRCWCDLGAAFGPVGPVTFYPALGCGQQVRRGTAIGWRRFGAAVITAGLDGVEAQSRRSSCRADPRSKEHVNLLYLIVF
jgi:hypothetical protein